MKNWLFSIVLITLTGCTDSAVQDVQSEFTLSPNETLAKHYAGRWVVVNYWAQWCKPCIEEIPELNALDKRYPGVAVVGVNFDGATGDDLDSQVEKFGINFPVLARDPAAELDTPRPAVLPTTLVLNPQGLLVKTLVGPQTLQSLALATQQITGTNPD